LKEGKVLYFRGLNDKGLKSFFKSFFATLLALVVFFGLIFILFFGIAGALLADEQVKIDNQSVLVIDLSKRLNDRKIDDPFAEISGDEAYPELSKAVKLIKYAAKDSLIKGIYLIAKDNGNGAASSTELRSALLEFKKSKKFIIAFGDYISQSAYSIAALSDKVYCHPKGMFEWQGMSVEYVFFKSLLDRLEIKPQIFYAGKFKSATEPFRETSMTPANKEQTQVWLNDLYTEMLSKVAESRGLSADSLKLYAEQFRIDAPEKAVQYKLIDGLKYDDEVKQEIKSTLGIAKADKINFVSLSDYEKAADLSDEYAKDKIAVVYAEGDIMYGKPSQETITSDEYLSILRNIRFDKSIKAVVLRVNSPGGSSLASEIIWREIEMIKKEGKKVVVSMGNVAASGGYYIACNANSIFVQPNTITGSIGVFSVIPDFSSFMKNKLGVTFDGVATSKYADVPSVTRAMTEEEKKIIQHEVDKIYLTFKTRVAEGRKLDLAYVDSIAQGRVWTGKRAIELKLADQIGGLEEAIAAAVKMSGVKSYRVKSYPEPKSFFEYIVNVYPDELSRSSLKKELGAEEYEIFLRLKELKNEKGEIKARMPFELSIH
jgi:protease-4